MALEKEVKVLAIEYDDVLVRLMEAGATPIFAGDLLTRYLDFRDGRLRKRDLRFRIRTAYPDVGEPSTEFGIKRKLKQNGVKNCDEHMIPVAGDRGHAIKMVVSLLGLRQYRKEHKRRESFLLDDLRFDFDKPRGEPIPMYAEVEGPSKERILYGVKLLGRPASDALAWSGTQLRAFYGIKD